MPDLQIDLRRGSPQITDQFSAENRRPVIGHGDIKPPRAIFRPEILLCDQVIELTQSLCQRRIQCFRLTGQVITALSADKQRILK